MQQHWFYTFWPFIGLGAMIPVVAGSRVNRMRFPSPSSTDSSLPASGDPSSG